MGNRRTGGRGHRNQWAVAKGEKPADKDVAPYFPEENVSSRFLVSLELTQSC